MFRAFPDTSQPLIEFHEALLRGASPFTEVEREPIAAYVSRLNRCRYCHGVHSATAERLGVPADTLDRLAEDIDLAPVSPAMRPVLRYAEKLTRDPGSVRRADIDAIVAAGWNETAIYHVVAVTALFNFMNHPVEGLGIELDPAYVPSASQRLADRGYPPLLEMISQ